MTLLIAQTFLLSVLPISTQTNGFVYSHRNANISTYYIVKYIGYKYYIRMPYELCRQYEKQRKFLKPKGVRRKVTLTLFICIMVNAKIGGYEASKNEDGVGLYVG